MSSPTNEIFLNPIQLKKEMCVLDLNESPPMISYEKNHTFISENVTPKTSSSCSDGLKASVNMVEAFCHMKNLVCLGHYAIREALATIPLSFKRQETSKSILVVDKGILTLVQHDGHDEEHVERPQGMHKRGLRTSWTEQFVDGHFDLPTECVNYILVRDKCRQRLPRFVGKRLSNVDTRRYHLSVYNRLEGWRVETRKRPNKTHDKFYHHRSSGRMFRSLVEVEKFIKYEMYPPNPRRFSKKRTKSTT